MNNSKVPIKIILTDTIHPQAHRILEQETEVITLDSALPADQAEHKLRQLITDAQGLIVRRKLPDGIFDSGNTLRGVVRHGVGLDFVPVDSATRHGIPVANTPDVNANSVAEYAITAILESARRLNHFDQMVRSGNWPARKTAPSLTFEVKGRTLGIIGFGAIGQRVAEIAACGLGMNIVVHTRSASRVPEKWPALKVDALFANSDFVVLACPLNDQTRGLINEQTLRHAKPGLMLINVARGAVINEPDLLDALENKIISGAVLDVFENQPLAMHHKLLTHPNVILTPHVAGMTQDSERAMSMLAVQTQLALIRGERPVNIVNPDFKTMRKSE
ncbi:hydroxyacid dehydrogenase [Advenella incenata]